MSRPQTAYVGARVFDGARLHENCALIVAGDRFDGIVPVSDVLRSAKVITLDGGTLSPGFVDIQVNGGGGVMFNDDPSVATLTLMANAHTRLGATSILATLITDTPAQTNASIHAVQSAISAAVPGIIGLHLEGPHLAVRRKGAHDAALIRGMDDADVALLIEAARRLPVLMVTLAPESVTPAQIGQLAKAGVILSLGHSDAGFAACQTAVAAGARCVTHLFNAMSPLGSREPGLVGAALRSAGVSAGIIADFVHVHPDTLAIALTAKQGPGQIFLVSDAMATAGSDIESFTLNGRRITRRNGRLTLADGTLAGADLDLATAVGNVQTLGVEMPAALAMATSVPAAVVGGGDRVGAIKRGRIADFIRLSSDTTLVGVWRRGCAVNLS
ncbi:MAG: N-acetylglucosamine-6-phosphate deacetylase [Paracoccaceae bacterium]|jgi:N-acetylglucosamine-6-phosphate deacetylase